MLDKSKLPPGLRARMLWAPPDGGNTGDRPIVLIADRRRFWLAGIPMVAAFLVALALFFFFHASRSLVIALLLIVLAIAWFGRRTGAAYYEVRADGKLGAHLGSRPPSALREMRRIPL